MPVALVRKSKVSNLLVLYYIIGIYNSPSLREGSYNNSSSEVSWAPCILPLPIARGLIGPWFISLYASRDYSHNIIIVLLQEINTC